MFKPLVQLELFRQVNSIVRYAEESMEIHTKAAAITAFKWSAGLSSGFVLGPIIMGLASGTAMPEKLIAEKLIVGIYWFPILFLGFWGWGMLTKKNPANGGTLDSKPDTIEAPPTANMTGIHVNSSSRKPSKWNYVGIGAGAFMLLFLFLPQIISGAIANQYYLGAAFWVGIIIYCTINISRAKEQK